MLHENIWIFILVIYMAVGAIKAIMDRLVISKKNKRILIFMCIILFLSAVVKFSKCRLIIKDDVLVRVENGIFQKKEDLASITIPDHITVIGESAFKFCRSLQEIKIPKGITYIGEFAFYGCSSLQSINLPEKITKIQSYTFARCVNLTDINLPDNISEIKLGAFKECKSLKGMVIPDSVTICGEEVFEGCTNLSDIKMSTNIAQIGADAFKGTSAIKYAGKKSDGIIYIDNVLVKGSNSLIRADVKRGTKVIAGNAFQDCYKLQEVSLPSGILAIGKNAFNNCINLEHINFPDSLSRIGVMAFRNCKIKSSDLTSVTHIGSEAFAGCTELSSVQLPDCLEQIGYKAFYNTSWIKQVPFDKYGCQYSGKILLCWEGDTSALVVKDGTKAICSSLWYRNPRFDVDLPDSISYIGSDFMSYGSILNDRVPDSLINIGSYGFAAFTIKTEELILPNGLETIGDYAFWNCTGFRTVVVPETVKDIGDHVFEDSKDLKKIKVPKHLKDTFLYEGKAKLIYY